MRFVFPSAFLYALAFGSVAPAADPTYWQDVRPIIRKHCTVCHSQKNLAEPDVSAGLALDSLEAIRKGGKRPVIVPGKSSESKLIAALRDAKPSQRMPLDAAPLPDATIALLKQWIDAGMPEGTKPVETSLPASTAVSVRRKTDVIIATKATLPKGVAKAGQTAPLEVILPVGPLSPVAAVAFSGDGRFLAAGSYGRVVVWDLKAGKVAKVLTNVLGAVNDLKFSPDSSQLVASGGQPSARGDIRLFNTADWKHIATLGGHTDVVGSVAFSPDGRFLASASFDKTVRVWNLSTRESVMTFTGHSDFVYAVAFGPKGDWLVTASKDKTARLIDAKNGQSRLTFSGTDQEVLAVAAKPDGSAVVTAGQDAALSWWNTQTGERIKRTPGHDIAVHEIAFSPNGEFAASGGADKTVRLWNAKAIDSQRTIPVGSVVYSVAASPDGKAVAAGSFDGLVRLFETATGRHLASLVGLGDEEWLAAAPEGFATAGSTWMKSGRWRTGPGKDVNTEWVWKAVGLPAQVAKALAGEKPGEPTFSTPQP
jgi:DNA-binding beta-propeller fold protein YncE